MTPPRPGDRDRMVDDALSDWLAEEAPPRARRELLERVLVATATSRQARPISLPLRVPFDPAQHRRPIGLGLVALALLLALGGLALAGAPRPVNVPVVTPSPASLSLVWGRLGSAGPFANATVYDVAQGGPGLVAVGSIKDNDKQVGAVWTSPDGVTWHRESVPPVTTATPVRVVSAGSRLLALLLPSCLGAICNGNPQTWVSTDGAHWTAAAPDLGDCRAGACSFYPAVAAGGPGFVLVGGRWALDPSGGTLLGMTVATSVDGVRWTSRVTAGSVPVNASAGAVAAGRAGLVATGTANDSPAVWTSRDAVTWNRVPASGVPASGQLDDVAANGRMYVAVGRDTGGAASWVSVDGRTWHEDPASPALAEAKMIRVVSAGAGFIAFGVRSNGNGEAWYSVDGLTWTPLATGDVFTGGPVLAAGLVGPSLVLFGTDQRGQIVVMVGN